MMHTKRLFFSLFIFLLAGVLAGCQSSSPAPAAASTPASSGAIAEQMSARIAGALKTSFSQPHHVESETKTESQPDKASTTVLEFVPPDRLHILGDPELLVVDQKVYMKKASEAKWTLTNQDAQNYTYGANFLEFKDIQAVKSLGTESLNGVPVEIYGFTSEMSGKAGPVKIWIGASDGRVYKFYYEGLVTSVSNTNDIEQVPASITMTFAYNASIQITPPPQ